MIDAQTLMSYLPRYYQDSRVMRAIMEAIAPEIPDAIGELWRVFFLSRTEGHEELQEFWRRELEEEDFFALLGKLRSGSLLNLEILREQGFDAIDTHRYSPESGYVLSGSESVFPDGKYFGPLIVDLYAAPETVAVARELVKRSSIAGSRYIFVVRYREEAHAPKATAARTAGIAPGVIYPNRTTDPVSGRPVRTAIETTVSRLDSAVVTRPSWWSPVVTFLEPVIFLAAELTAQFSSVKQES